MKKIVTVYNENDWNRKIPFKDSPKTRESFEDWHKRGLKHGIEMYRASIDWYDKKSGVFKKAWAYRNKKWQKLNSPVKPDLIFDKIAGKYDFKLFDFKIDLLKKAKVFNHPLFRTLLDNKLAQYLYFGEFMPKTFLATDANELKKNLKILSGKKIVIKPLYGSGGFGIIIVDKNKIAKKRIKFPVLIQEFIKSNKGIPGFSKKNEISDLRMIFINHKFIYALSRIAKNGSLFTNFHQGAAAIIVPEKSIPVSAKNIAKKIIDKLSIYSKANYSLDFMFTNEGKPVLVEMNTTPGFDLLQIIGNERIKEKHFQEFIKVIN